MNIALFSDAYLPDINGVATSTNILKIELEKHGHHVLVVTTSLPEGSTYEDKGNVLRVSGIDIKKLYGYRVSKLYSHSVMKKIREFEPDLIHIQTEFSIGIFGKIAAEMLNVPVCYTYHTMWEDYTHYISSNKLGQDALKKVIEKLSKIYGDSCDTLIVPSKKTAEAIKGYGITNDIHIVPTGLLLDKFSIENINHQQVYAIKKEYQLEDQFTIIFLGRIAEEKNIKIVLDAITKINDPHVTFMVVGGGPQLDELKEYALSHSSMSHICFTGPQDPTIVPSFYHASDLFISASMSETQGLTYIEAMASSLPVLAKKDDNLTEVIVDDYNGNFFDTEEELIALINQYKNKDLSELSKNALKHSMLYSSTTFYNSIIKVYEKSLYNTNYIYKVTQIIEQLDHSYKVNLSYGKHELTLVLPKSVIKRYSLEVGVVLDRDNVDALKDQEQVIEAYNKALKYLSYKDYTYSKMSKKLLDKTNFDPIIIDITMDELINKGLINDRAYIDDYFKHSSSKNIGVNKIVDKLKKEGVAPVLIDEYLENYSYQYEEEKATALIQKIYDLGINKSKIAFITSLKKKLFDKGFASSTIDQAISQFDFSIPKEHTLMVLSKECEKVYQRYQKKYQGYELKLKMITFLIRKGYEYDDILEVLEGYDD